MSYDVASFSEAWIEIYFLALFNVDFPVASFSEAWIEMVLVGSVPYLAPSPPSRRRGLKLSYLITVLCLGLVASFSEAWIEIFAVSLIIRHNDVASFSEAWIEIPHRRAYFFAPLSPPSRRRGLKFHFTRQIFDSI